MSPTAPPLECRDLSRYFGPVVGLEGLSIRLEPGEIFGLVGLNGAGKSTALRLIVGLLVPSRGEALLFGEPSRRALASRRRLGYLPSELALYRDRSGDENLDFLASLCGPAAREARRRREALAARLGLDPVDLGRPVGEMSHGMRQKIGLLQAFEHDPDLVLLDEPSDGLDPVARVELASLLAEVRARGGTVLLASHVLSEVERVADRMGVLHRGRLVALETRESLRRREALRIEATFSGQLPSWSGLPGVEVVESRDGRLVLRAAPPLDAVIRRLADAQVVDLRIEAPDLEDLVRSIARGETT